MDKENNSDEAGVATFNLKRASAESTIEPLSRRRAKYSQMNYVAERSCLATIRPPRDPKQSHSVNTIGSTNSTIINSHHRQSQNSSIDINRSSSQPRISRTAEALPSVSMHCASRSVSQPRASQNAHFLDGFNVADCFDVRAIPDPPPPSPDNSRNCRSRRASSAVLRPVSSRNVTNRKDYQIIRTHNTIDSDTNLSCDPRRKRKPILSVPSLVNQMEGQKLDLDTTVLTSKKGQEVKCDVELKLEGLHRNLCTDNNEGMVKLGPKRRKKRQSLVIPSHLPLKTGIYSSETKSTNHFTSENENGCDSLLKPKKDYCPVDFKSMKKLRSLVRGYCDLPLEEERGLSKEAKEIQSITGYTLPRKVKSANEINTSEVVLSNRRLVIQQIAPVLGQMEKRKKRDIECWQIETKCLVSKSEKSGRYKYYDIETNKKVSSQEYKRRYISILQNDKRKRLSRARQWINELSHESKTKVARKKSELPSEAGTMGIQSDDNISVPKHSISIDSDRTEQNHFHSDTTKHKQASFMLMNTSINFVKDETVGRKDIGPRNFLDISSRTLSGDGNGGGHQPNGTSTVDKVATSEAEIVEASSEDTDDNRKEKRKSVHINSTASELVAPKGVDGFKSGVIENILPRYILETRFDNSRLNMNMDGTNDTENLPLHPLLVKDVDLDIAAAEKRLWEKIDLALLEYSGEIMMIENKNRRSHSHLKRTFNADVESVERR